MSKSKLITAITAAVALSASAAYGSSDSMEKCKVVDKEGQGLIKAHKADCAGGSLSCAGQNKAGEPDAWIFVPKGECKKINAGDFSGVSKEIKEKIEGAK